MRTIIYITGISASGKSLAAERLSKELNVPVMTTDIIYQRLGEIYKMNDYDTLFNPDVYDDYPGMRVNKKILFAEALAQYDGDLIIDGYSLYFAVDYKIIEQIIGPHRAIRFHLVLPYEEWVGYLQKKFNKDHAWLTNLSKHEYNLLLSTFRGEGLEYYNVGGISQILQSHHVYQREGFTDKKIACINLPEDMTGMSVLDIGCNAGMVGKYCREHGARYIVGMDTNWRYLEDAKANGYDKVALADINGDWVPEERFDLVLCLAVLHYAKNKQRVIRELAQVTRGLCVIEMPISRLPGMNTEKISRPITATFTDEIEIPTEKLMLKMLRFYFADVRVVGESVSTDGSYRLVFHCKKDVR